MQTAVGIVSRSLNLACIHDDLLHVNVRLKRYLQNKVDIYLAADMFQMYVNSFSISAWGGTHINIAAL